MIEIDCGELKADEQLALAAAISDQLEGSAVALVKDTRLVLDPLGNPEPDPSRIEAILKHFISRRKNAQYYSIERDGSSFVVHSADPLARGRGRRMETMPDNLLKCPFCAYVTPYRELYLVHTRAHGFGAV
jgi:hypothetical protein